MNHETALSSCFHAIPDASPAAVLARRVDGRNRTAWFLASASPAGAGFAPEDDEVRMFKPIVKGGVSEGPIGSFVILAR